MDIFSPLVDLFNFIGSIFQTIYDGITGIITILSNIIELIFNIIGILPQPLYNCLFTFVSLYLIIFTYKIFRKG